MKFKVLLVLLLIPAAALLALTIQIEDYDNLSFESPLIINPGAPALRYLPLKILLPMGEELTAVDVQYAGEQHKMEMELAPVQKPQPLSREDISITPRNEKIYNSNALYPHEDYKIAGVQRQNGYDLLYLHLYPWHYNPAAKEISWHAAANIEITTVYSEELRAEQSAKLIKNNHPDWAVQKILNAQAASSYQKTEAMNFTRDLADPAEPYKMILITSQNSAEWFTEFIDWKYENGLETGVFFTEDIYAEYEGNNNQAKIKNFITDAYETYAATDTPLEYVILGGDDEIIPIRGVFINAGGTVDENMPSDVFYSCLDNDWDGNDNGVYGEVEDMVDLVPEIAIGRIPADNHQDVSNWFNKLTHYVDNNTYSNNICYMLGEYLWDNPDTWGGDSMDLLLDVVDEPFHVETMYQRDGTYSEYGVTQAINGGLGLINHLGHANEGFVFGQTRPSAADYYNTEYGFVYTQGCYPAAFDEATGQASECIAENFIIRSGGMFGFIGNSRYGWGIPGQPADGPSQRYHLPFIEAIFDLDIREFGKALAYSRVAMADQAIDAVFLRWVHYELTFFGDPSIELKEPDIDFPYLYPQSPVYTDTEGDGDGAINPGETIEITIPVTADFDWANAQDVAVEIVFADTAVTALNSVVNYGTITAGETLTADPIIVQVPQDCSYDAYPYSVIITAPVGDDGEFNKTYYFDFEVSLNQTNWPWFISERLSVAPIITDLDDDDTFDILATTMSGDMYGLNQLAQEIDGTQWNTGETIENQTSLGDVDNDGEAEIVLATRAGNIYARDLDGTIAWQYSHDADQLLTPVLADIDADGLLETISFGMDREIIALDENGEMEDNFPVVLDMNSFHEMAAADFDEDDAAEIAIATLDGNLHLIDHNGSELPGFPVDLGSTPSCGVTILDNLNLVVSTINARLFVVSSAGEILTEKEMNHNLAAEPVTADFDNDGILEIAYTGCFGDVDICEQDGSDLPGWPLVNDYSISQPPLAVDINNTGNLNLIWFSSINTLYVYDHLGQEIEFSPVPYTYNSNFPASIADLDNDYDYEIVLSTSNRVLVIDCKLPKGSLAPWTTYRGNLQRTGFYGDNPLTDSTIDNITPQNILHNNYPNPFNPQTIISYQLADHAESVLLNIYNIKGQKIFTQNINSIEPGLHQIVWQGKDNSGSSCSSGIYFYQLKIDDKITGTKKMMLLK